MIGSGNNFGSEHHSAPMSEINTTPLVDVMLVLLVIFIITAPLLTHAVKIDLPQASSQAAPDKPEIINISINEQGQVYWNEALLVEGELTGKLQEAAKMDPQPEVRVRADKETRYQILVELMADARNAGIKALGFVSDPKN
jgi:biopolymer transport protein ExbD